MMCDARTNYIQGFFLKQNFTRIYSRTDQTSTFTTENSPYILRLLLTRVLVLFSGRTAFEKLTELDYKGTAYYTVKNLTLYECQGWCREEPECQAASFR